MSMIIMDAAAGVEKLMNGSACIQLLRPAPNTAKKQHCRSECHDNRIR